MGNIARRLGDLDRYPAREESAIQFRLRTLFLVFTLACVLLAGVVFAISVVRAAIAAEDSLQAFFRAYNPTMEYVELNNGKWPRSWDDLASVEPSNDYDWVAQHIQYDFDANAADLAKLTPETFIAIKNKRRYYNFDSEIQSLIDRLRQFHPQP